MKNEIVWVLEKNIVDSELLSLAAKKMLNALVSWYLNTEKAQKSGIVVMNNNQLCAIAGISKSSIQSSALELKMFSLAERRPRKGTC